MLAQVDGLTDELIDLRLRHTLNAKELQRVKDRVHLIRKLWKGEKR